MTKMEKAATFSRRSLLQAGGAFVVSVGMPIGLDTVLGIGAAHAQGARPPLTPDQLSSYIAVSADGSVSAFFGKTDMAQGLYTGIGQIVAEELDVPFNRVTVIMGNTCLYGATGGELYAAGRAGERFAVRNSGALAVVEGTGDHCCEYMTGGVVCVLGTTGVNFGAGFTGGFAYVLDMERDFVDRYNHDLIDIHRVSPEGMGTHVQHLRGLIEQHVEATGSAWGAQLLNDFRSYIGRFWVVKPKASAIDSLLENLRRAA